MKNAGKARSYGLYRHLRTSKEIIENLLNYSYGNNQMLRSPTLRGILQAQQKQVEVWGADDIAAQREKCGRAGSPTRIIRSFIPKTDFKAVEIVGKPIQQASTLVNELGSVYSDLFRKAID